MVVAGRVLEDGDVAIMMVEAESTPQTLKLLADAETTGAVAPDEETVAEGLEAAKPFIAALCEAQRILAAAAVEAGTRPGEHGGVPRSSPTTATTSTRRSPARSPTSSPRR